MANYERKLIWKVYQEDETFIEVLDDVISDLEITKIVNGGDSEFRFRLDRKMDDFDEGSSIAFNNRVKVYVQDSYNPAGDKLVAYGYIISYSPFLRGKQEGVEVTCLSAISKLTNDFYRLGTTSTASDLGKELLDKRVDEMMEDIITHYRLTESNSMLSNDFSNADSTTDNAGNIISFNHRFFNMKHLDALRESSKFLPRNKEGGYYFYWRIETDGKLWVKNISTTADHTFKVGKHITEISGSKTIEEMTNRVYFWNEKGTVDPEYIKINYTDTSSAASYDTVASYLTDSKITTSTAATLLAYSRVYDGKDPKVQIKVTLNGDYDLASIRPGQTCQILNLKDNPYKVGSDTTLFINSIKYSPDYVILELSEPFVDFTKIVENERQRLDQEMTWYGKITQDLRASQLAPADRVWSTDLRFSATTGGDAYRQVDWTAGNVYIPDGSEGYAKRVICAGNTGLMTAGTHYYVFLDEESLPDCGVSQESGTGVVQEGGEVLYDSGKAWTNDQWKGYIISIGGQKKIIKENTQTILTIEDRWTISDQSSAYNIYKHELQATSTASAAMADSRIVFTNVQAATDSSSAYIPEGEAIIVPVRDPSININGQTQISAHTIIADRLVANTITAGYIEAINLADLKSPPPSPPSNGIMINYDGIYGKTGGVTTFSIERSTGNAYFSGTVEGGIVRTASSGIRTVLDGADNKLKFMSGSTVYGYMLPWTDGVAPPWTTTRITQSSGNDKSQIHIGETSSGVQGSVSILTYGTYSTSLTLSSTLGGAELSGQNIFLTSTTVQISGNPYPTSNFGQNLGGVSNNWDNIYCDSLYKGSDPCFDFSAANIDCFKHFIPAYDNTYTLGDSTYGWANLFLTDNVDPNIYRGGDIHLKLTGANLECHRNFVPDTSGTKNLGSGGQWWNDVHYVNLVVHTPKVMTNGLAKLRTIKPGADLKVDATQLDKEFQHESGGIKTDQLIMALAAAIQELEDRLDAHKI